jgi:hypothetical protein
MTNNDIRKQPTQSAPQKPRPPQRSGQAQQEASADPQHLDVQDEERKVERRLSIDPDKAR